MAIDHSAIYTYLGAGGAGALIYLAAHVKRIREFDPRHFVESAACCVGLVAGLHMVYGSVKPDGLVHAIDERNHAHLNVADLKVVNGRDPPSPSHAVLEMTDLHRVHMFFGGLALAAFGGYGACGYCFGSKPH